MNCKYIIYELYDGTLWSELLSETLQRIIYEEIGSEKWIMDQHVCGNVLHLLSSLFRANSSDDLDGSRFKGVIEVVKNEWMTIIASMKKMLRSREEIHSFYEYPQSLTWCVVLMRQFLLSTHCDCSKEDLIVSFECKNYH